MFLFKIKNFTIKSTIEQKATEKFEDMLADGRNCILLVYIHTIVCNVC